jgi:NAD(P)-dependent dehydrogenase (short-subunit alcohol dehydrogenase family)
MKLELTGKRALVTGASKGIGAATARALAREGCDVALVARTDADLRRVATGIERDCGVHVSWMAVDLAEPGAPDRVAERFPDVDILVNNAGAVPYGSLFDVDEASWRRGWDLKVFGYVNMTRLYYAAMKARGAGVIINIIGPLVYDAQYVCGLMGNAALHAMTLALGAASHKDGIRVVGVSPGPVATERLAAFPDLAGRLAFGRAASVEEIADTVAFLASPRAGYLTGTIVNVDGGLAARPPSG